MTLGRFVISAPAPERRLPPPDELPWYVHRRPGTAFDPAVWPPESNWRHLAGPETSQSKPRNETMPPERVDRNELPAEWPTHRGTPAFWEELGRTVAAFGFLEDTLARACFALTATCEYANIGEAEAAFAKWGTKLERSLTDTLASLTSKIGEVFENDDRVPADVGSDIVRRLHELAVWRNALCHGAWVRFDADGSAWLRYFRRTSDGPEALDCSLSPEEIANIRTATVDVTLCLMDTVARIGVRFPGTKRPSVEVAR